MGVLRQIERRREDRAKATLIVAVWGVDTKGDRFLQLAQARQISLSGALLSGINVELRSGDILGLLYAGKKARYRVVWVRFSGNEEKMQAAIHRVEPDLCPWQDLLAEQGPVQPETARMKSE